MPGLTRGLADRVPQAFSARVVELQTWERAPVTAEANPQVSRYPTAEPQAHEDPLPGTEKAGVGALGPTNRPMPEFPDPPPLTSHGPARIIAMCNQKGGVG